MQTLNRGSFVTDLPSSVIDETRETYVQVMFSDWCALRKLVVTDEQEADLEMVFEDYRQEFRAKFVAFAELGKEHARRAGQLKRSLLRFRQERIRAIRRLVVPSDVARRGCDMVIGF
jgi:hypothetical protein